MKRINNIIIILLLFPALVVYTQDWEFEQPNYKKIKRKIKKKNSPFYHESLMDRYLIPDSTFTLEEKRHLYYGYVFNKQYSPYALSEFHDSLKVIIHKEKHNKIELDAIIRFTDSILIAYPFDLRAINYQIYAFEQSGRIQDFEKRILQFLTLVDAILSSGNGTCKEEAFYVINTTDEYVVLNILGFEFGGTQSLIDHYDYLTVSENEAGIEGLYFDISPSLNTLAKMFKD